MKRKTTLLWIGIIIAVALGYFQIVSSKTITLQNEILINASPEKVWAVLTDIEAVEHYNPQVEKATCISTAKEGAGACRECRMKDGSSVRERILSVEPNQAVTIELYESPWPVQDMRWRTNIEPSNNVTLVTQELNYRVKYGALGALMNAIMMKDRMDESIKGAFAGLKQYAETR